MTSIDVGIIGGGPAGLTAAATLARQLHTAVVFDSGHYRNNGTPHLHTVPGWEHKDPVEFRKTSREQIEKNYKTIQFADVAVASVEKEGELNFKINDDTGKIWEVKKLILAVGSSDMLPEIEGYAELWKKKIGAESAGVLAVQVLAMVPALAIHMADNAAQLAKKVTIFTNGSEEVEAQCQTMARNSPFLTNKQAITRMVKNSSGGVKIEFENGEFTEVSFLVHSPLTIPQGPFVQQLGLSMTQTGDVQADGPAYQTNVKGVFAAGDCITPYKVVPHAIASGNFAAVAAATQLQAEKYNHFSLV